MKKKYFYNVWGNFKCNYFKILAVLWFLYCVYGWIIFDKYSANYNLVFTNIKSSQPILTSAFITPYLGGIGLILILIMDNINKNLQNTEKICINIKFPKIYLKALTILIFFITYIVCCFWGRNYTFIPMSNHFRNMFVINPSSTLLRVIIISFAFITMLILLMIFNLINKTAFIEKELNIISNKNIDTIPSNVAYIKKFIWFVFISTFLTFIYVSKVYLSNTNFQNIKLGFADYTGALSINSKMDVLLLTGTILYVGLISLFLLLVLYTTMTKIMSIKNHIIDIKKSKTLSKVSLSSNGTWIKVLALINILISAGLSVYVYKYFGKNHITIYLPTGTQSPIVSNPVTVVLSITNFYIGVVVSTFLFMIYKVRDDVKFIEGNLDIISNNQEN